MGSKVPVAAGRTWSSSRPNAEGHGGGRYERITGRTFVELLQERPLWTAPRRKQLAHNMVLLLPKVHRLLILLPAFQQ